jgi:hypothetical protein
MGRDTRKLICFVISLYLISIIGKISGQENKSSEPAYPSGITVAYGIGHYSIKDEYISGEKYTGSLPYYSLSWAKRHDKYTYVLDMSFRYSDNIQNYNVSTEITQFTLNHGFLYPLRKISLFGSDLFVWLGPSSDFFFLYNKPKIAVSGFDYAQSFAILFSLGFNANAVYRPLAEASEGDEIYFVLNGLLAELKDGHVYYHTDGGGEIYPFYPSRHFKDRHAYSPFVVRRYFDRELKLTLSRSAEYEILPENIGYVFLSDFQGDYLVNEFPSIIGYFRNTKGIIIDIRQKRGGNYQTVLSVVRWFLESPLEPPKLFSLGNLVEQSPLEPLKSGAYLKPVVVLINGSTFSAGEVITEMLKQLPNVTAVGDTTGGGGVASTSDPPEAVGEFYLPSGKMIYVGTWYIERYDGHPFEWLGIPPDIRVEQTENDILNNRDRQLEYAKEMLK